MVFKASNAKPFKVVNNAERNRKYAMTYAKKNPKIIKNNNEVAKEFNAFRRILLKE